MFFLPCSAIGLGDLRRQLPILVLSARQRLITFEEERMRFAIRLFLITALAIGSLGCNRGNAPDQPVSANSDQTGRSAEPQPNNTVQQPPAQTERQPAQEPRQAYRTPEKSASRPNPAETPRMRVTESVASGTAITVTLADT